MTSLPFSRPRACAIIAAAVMLVVASCEQEAILDKVREQYEAGEYREAIFLARHHFRRGGERSAPLLFLMGRSYLRLGIEAEAEDVFAELYRADSTWAPRIAAELRDEAIGDLEKGNESRGKRFVAQALAYDDDCSFGAWDALAGRVLFDRREYRRAAVFFERWLASSPDSAGAAETLLNLGEARENAGEIEGAMGAYREFLDRYPLSRLRTTVRWKFENLLYSRADSLFRGGEPGEAEHILADLAAGADNPLVRERANFLLGELYEEQYDYDRAVRFYREVINLSLGSSGRLVDRAKERIERIEKSR